MLACMAGALVLHGIHGACLSALALATLLGRRRLRGPSRGGQRHSPGTQPGKGKEACSQGGLNTCVRWLSAGQVFHGVRRSLCWRQPLVRRLARALPLSAGLLGVFGGGSSPPPSEVAPEAVRVILTVCQHLHCSRASRGSIGAKTVLCAGGVHRPESGAWRVSRDARVAKRSQLPGGGLQTLIVACDPRAARSLLAARSPSGSVASEALAFPERRVSGAARSVSGHV